MLSNKNALAVSSTVAIHSLLALSQIAAPQPEGVAGAIQATSPQKEKPMTYAQSNELAIQETWLKVPRACKDRTFSFDPVSVGRERMSKEITSLYRSFDESA
jgi:hypothetical protein